MPVTTSATASDILNRVAVEVGLTPEVAPYSTTDESFIQLQYLLNSCGEELSLMHDWGFLVREAVIDTTVDPSGKYPLPDDFLHITNQTCWERKNRVPVVLLSAQDWQYLEGRQFASDTIYVKFRLQQGQFTLYPQPTPAGLEVAYEYTSKNWVQDSQQVDVYTDSVKVGTDKPLFDRTLMIKMLKVKWLEAKGFDSSKAQDDLNFAFANLIAFDKGAPTLNAGGGMRGLPLLDMYRNTSDTNYGSS